MADRHPHPSVFMFLIVPYGVMSGYLSVSVAYLLSRNHITVEQVAALIAASFLPHTWKFVWAPICDTLLKRKTWYLAGSVVSSVGIMAMGVLPMTPAQLPLLTVIVVVANFAVTLVCMGTESLMAYAVPEDEKGRAGGWFQAGYLGGAGLGGGAGLWLAQHYSAPWLSGTVLGAVCLACAAGLFFIREPAGIPTGPGIGARLGFVLKDNWHVVRARLGFLALLLAFLPVGSGAAGQLWAAVADDWHASAKTVALVTGVLSGLISAAGCLVGGWASDRMNRKLAYLVYGVLQAACAVGMAFGPRSEGAYVGYTSVYAFITGLTYAGFTAYVLEAMGMGAAATKYSLFASLSNFPIVYVTAIDGHAHTRWGSRGMLLAEAATGMAGLVLFVAVWSASRRWWPGPERAESPMPALAVAPVSID